MSGEMRDFNNIETRAVIKLFCCICHQNIFSHKCLFRSLHAPTLPGPTPQAN